LDESSPVTTSEYYQQGTKPSTMGRKRLRSRCQDIVRHSTISYCIITGIIFSGSGNALGTKVTSIPGSYIIGPVISDW
jgi:hypothetical protein